MKKGFTLIELLVVLAIAISLLCLGYGAFKKWKAGDQPSYLDHYTPVER